MKANIQIEVDSDELKQYGWELLTKAVVTGTHAIGHLFDGIDPQTTNLLANLIMQMQQTLLRQGPRVQVGMPRGPYGAAQAGMPYGGPPPYPYPYPPPPGGVGMPYYPPPYGPPRGGPMPDNVRPIGVSGPVVERCFTIEATRHMEAGIVCCKCTTVNAVQRVECRNCGHKICVIAPPPEEPREKIDAEFEPK